MKVKQQQKYITKISESFIIVPSVTTPPFHRSDHKSDFDIFI